MLNIFVVYILSYHELVLSRQAYVVFLFLNVTERENENSMTEK